MIRSTTIGVKVLQNTILSTTNKYHTGLTKTTNSGAGRRSTESFSLHQQKRNFAFNDRKFMASYQVSSLSYFGGSLENKRCRTQPFTTSSKSLLSSSSTKSSSSLPKESPPLFPPAGPLYKIMESQPPSEISENDATTLIQPGHSDFFIPEVSLHDQDGRSRNRVLV
jgi:hypothetical protein